MSEQVEARLIELLGNPTESPYGNPIPGLDELDAEPAERFLAGVVNLLDVAVRGPEPVEVTVRRLGEPIQVEPELLGDLRNAGVQPGSTVRLLASGATVTVQAAGADAPIELPHEVAAHIYVQV